MKRPNQKPAETPAEPASSTAPIRLELAEPVTLPLASIEHDPSINCRAGGVSEAVARDYAAALVEGAVFPPVVVFRNDAGKHWLADGFHRAKAHELAGMAEVAVDVREGDRRAALLYAAGCNATHGARRCKADVRRAVLALLQDPEWSQWSDREIAARCSVSPTTVGKVRAQLSTVDSSSPRRGRDGKVRRAPKAKTGRRRPVKKFNPAKPIRRVLALLGPAADWPEDAIDKLKAALSEWANVGRVV